MKAAINKANCTLLAKNLLPDGTDIITDKDVQGFRARRYSKRVSLIFQYVFQGKKREIAIGTFGTVTPDNARKAAIKYAGLVADDKDPAAEKTARRTRTGKTVNALLDMAVAGHFKKKKTGDQAITALDKFVRPIMGDMLIYDVKRSDVSNMLRKVPGERQADLVLAYVRKAFRWFAANGNDDTFVSCIVPGMGMSSDDKLKRRRERVLDAEEIRDVFAALDACVADGSVPFCYRPFIHTLFYTCTRLRMPAEMTRDEVKGRIWIVPKERNKGGKLAFLVTLSDTMLALMKNNNAPFVFSSDGGETDFSGFSKSKKALDKKIAEMRKADGRGPMPKWVHHDIRRTGRFLMGQNGVASDIAERVLGHVIGGVRGVYDPNLVYAYQEEKRQALMVLEKVLRHVLAGGALAGGRMVTRTKVLPFKKKA